MLKNSHLILFCVSVSLVRHICWYRILIEVNEFFEEHFSFVWFFVLPLVDKVFYYFYSDDCRGHVLIIGHDGCGKMSTLRIAAFTAGLYIYCTMNVFFFTNKNLNPFTSHHVTVVIYPPIHFQLTFYYLIFYVLPPI